MKYTSFLPHTLRSLMLSTILLLATKISAQDISVSPAVLTFAGLPGKVAMETLTIYNAGKEPYTLLCSIKDWQRDLSGNKLYAEEGTLVHSNSAWITLPENSFILAPGERKKLTIGMEVPAGLQDTIASNCMLFVTQTNPKKADSGTASIGIQVAYEFGVQLFYNPATVKKGEIEYVQMDFLQAGVQQQPAEVVLLYKNNGGVNKTGTIKIELTHKESGEEFKIDAVPFAIMPYAEQKKKINLPTQLKTGNYFVISLLDAGHEYNLKVAEKDIYVQ